MITDVEARRIACDWHGGGGSALYALCSTGAITDDTARECRNTMATNGEVYGDLLDVIDYCQEHGTRGPVPGWHESSW